VKLEHHLPFDGKDYPARLDGAANAFKNLKRAVLDLRAEADNEGAAATALLAPFREAVEDDLNMPRALAAMWAVLTRLEEPKKASLNLAQKLKLYNGTTLPRLPTTLP